MMRGWPLVFVEIALGLFVCGVGVVSIREQLPSSVVVLIAIGDLIAVTLLVGLASRMRSRRA